MAWNTIANRTPEWFTSAFDDTYVAGAWRQMDAISYGDLMIDLLGCASNDTVDHHLMVAGDADDGKLFASVLIPAGSGHGAIAPVDVIAAIFPSAFHYVVLGKENGPNLWIALEEVVSSGRLVSVQALGGYI